MDKSKLALGVALVAVLIAIGGYFFPQQLQKAFGTVGGVTNYNSLGISQLKVGSSCNDEFGYSTCNGSALSGMSFGTCALINDNSAPEATSFTVAATSTASYSCTATNVLTTDTAVFAQFATTTSAGNVGWWVTGASASTTAGAIVVTVYNGTGGSAIIPASLASSTHYMVLR